MDRVTYPQLDGTDQRIVDMLRQDGRRPFRDIARELEVSESMVRKRVNRLSGSGWMRILAVTDPIQLGVPVLATTYVKVTPAGLEALADDLARDPAARYVAIGVGSSNLVFESMHGSARELHEFLQRKLSVPEVLNSETVHVVDIKKSVWDWEIPVAKEEEE